MFKSIYPSGHRTTHAVGRFGQTLIGASLLLTSQAGMANECEPDAFNTTNTNTIISEIYRQGAMSGDCIGELFEIGATTAELVFRTNTLNAVISEAQTKARNYRGNGDEDLASLYYFVRGAYYVDSQYSSFNINASVVDDAGDAIEAFVDNSRFKDANDEHANLLYNALVLIDSIGEHARFYPVIKDWLSSWDQSYQNVEDMDLVIATVLYLLRREFSYNEHLLLNDPDVIHALEDFLDNDWMLGTDMEDEMAEGAALLGYFTTLEWYGSDNHIESTVDAALNRLFSRYSPTGSGKSLWGNAAGEALYWGDCSKYTDVCDYETVFVEPLLKDVYYCDDFFNNNSNTRFRAQDMTTSQARETCELLDAELTRFSDRFGTTVVKNDHSDTLDMVVFDSKADYQLYSTAIFGNSTNNGGIFLEGSPEVVGNEARFITYEYEDSDDPGFKIKNVEHEYVHYLDGRINKYGGFSTASPSNGGNTVWWSEGLAEYVAWQDNSPYAPEAMMDGYHTLSEVFKTDYNDSVAQIYDWSYAASRFMKECHGSDVDIMLENLRSGDYGRYLRYLEKIGTSYNDEFDRWTPGLAANEPASQTSRACDGTSTSDSGTSLSPQTVQSGDSVSVSLSEAEETLFRIAVPGNAPEAINVSVGNEDGDVDIYVLADEAAYIGGYDCKNDDYCSVAIPTNTPDYYYVMARGYYDDNTATISFTFGESDGGGDNGGGSGGNGLEHTPSTNNEYIDSFTLAGVTKTTGDDDGYGDHTSQSAIPLADGDVLSIESSAVYDENWAAWIDLNDDGVFAAGEQIYSASGGNSTSGAVSIPLGASGTHTLRIAMAWNQTPDPLGFVSGEIEDWTVTLDGSSGGSTGVELFDRSSRVISFGEDEQFEGYITVPSGATDLVIAISGNNGDADLYVNRGSYSGESDADCFLDAGGSNEVCNEREFGTTRADTYYIIVKGYRGQAVSDITLTTNYD